jgi:hypothetical protein
MQMSKARPTMSGSLIKHKVYLNLQKYKFCKNVNRNRILLKFILEINTRDIVNIGYRGEGYGGDTGFLEHLNL